MTAFDNAAAQLDNFLGKLDAVTDIQALASKIPVIGDKLSGISDQFFSDLRGKIATALNDLNTTSTATTAGAQAHDIQVALNQACHYAFPGNTTGFQVSVSGSVVSINLINLSD